MQRNDESIRILVNGEAYDVAVQSRERDAVSFVIDGRSYRVSFESSTPAGESSAPASTETKNKRSKKSKGAAPKSGQLIEIKAPIPGVITELACSVGETVAEGEIVLRLEAMKMQNSILAPADGNIEEILVEAGSEVSDGQVMIRLRH